MIGTGISLIGVLIAVLAWQFPRVQETFVRGDELNPGASPTSISGAKQGNNGLDGELPATAAPSLTYLGALRPRSGAANLTDLPDPLRDQPGYQDAIAIHCPTNANDDKTRRVTYLLRGRYRDFSAMVQPYFFTEPDAQSQVEALSAVRQRDGTLTLTRTGSQFGALMTTPGRITATVVGAEELQLQVSCEHPQGVVILVGAGLA